MHDLRSEHYIFLQTILLFLFPFSLPRVLYGKLAIFIMRLELYRRRFSWGYNVSSVQGKWIYFLQNNLFSWSSFLISHTSLKTSILASFIHSFLSQFCTLSAKFLVVCFFKNRTKKKSLFASFIHISIFRSICEHPESITRLLG